MYVFVILITNLNVSAEPKKTISSATLYKYAFTLINVSLLMYKVPKYTFLI